MNLVTKEQLKQWYEVEQRSYRWLMAKLGTKSARRIKKILEEHEIAIRHGSEAVATQWVGNDSRRQATSTRAKQAFKDFWGTQSKRPEVAKKISESKIGELNPMWGRKGPNHHNWLGGKKSWERGRKIKTNKKKKLIQDLGGKCRQCGTTKQLTIHHDPPWRETRSHDPSHLIVLCKDCHFYGPISLR
jgi:hypothetical protein